VARQAAGGSNLAVKISFMAASCLRLRYTMHAKTLDTWAQPHRLCLGKTLGRRFAEPLAWVLGKFLPPPKNLPPL